MNKSFKKSNKLAHNFKDLTGQKIRFWTVLKRTNYIKRRDPIWKCECICGKIKLVSGNSLRNGSLSCGCKANRKWRLGKFSKPLLTAMRNVYARYRCEANRRDLEFKLTFNQFKNFLNKPCFYCNKYKTSYQKMQNGKNMRYNGIDRVDNTKGYTLSNCVTSCKMCNIWKKSITPNMIKKVYEFLFK